MTVGRSVMVPTTSEAGHSVDPMRSNTMALQHLCNQGIDPISVHGHTTISGSAGTTRPMRTRRSRSRSRTPPRQYRRRRSHHYRSDRDKSPYQGKSLFSGFDDSYSSSNQCRQLGKSHRSPSSSRSLRFSRRPRLDLNEGSYVVDDRQADWSCLAADRIDSTSGSD